MRDDELDRLLTRAMAPPPPPLSPGFDRRVLRDVEPRRLTAIGRTVMASYAVVASTIGAWALAGLPAIAIGAALTTTALVGAGAIVYGRRLVGSR